MANSALKQLLKEYEQKRLYAQEDLDRRKAELYQKVPRLQELEQDLNHTAIQTAKSILNSGNSNSMETLKQKISVLQQERKTLLLNSGLKEDYLQPHYECTVCKDTGYITQNAKTIMCNCLKQALFNIEFNKCNISTLGKENFDHFSFDVYSDQKNPEQYKSELSPRENMQFIKQIALDFIQNFDDPDEKNLLFTGNTGLGKTFLTNCIANELLKNKKTILYQTAPVMFDSIINSKFNKSSDINSIYQNILDVDLLIIDDLGTECMNSMKFTELFTIVNTRLLNQNNKITKTIISTNLSLQNLFSIYDERIISRIIGAYHICHFYGDDIRFINKINNK